MLASPTPRVRPSTSTAAVSRKKSSASPTGSFVRMTRKGPPARPSKIRPATPRGRPRAPLEDRPGDGAWNRQLDLGGVALIRGVEDPDASAERLFRRLKRVERKLRIRSLHDGGAERRTLLDGVEIERLVAEEDVVGAAGRREPGGRIGAGLLANRGLAGVHVGRLVPAPRGLHTEERGDGEEDDDDPGSARPPGDTEDARRDEHLEEGEDEDEMSALEKDARLGTGQEERHRGHDDHGGGQEHG